MGKPIIEQKPSVHHGSLVRRHHRVSPVVAHALSGSVCGCGVVGCWTIGRVVVGGWLILGLSDHDYYSWEELVYYQGYTPNGMLEDVLCEFHPDILVVDRFLEC
jgi:hypothetical protein